MRKCMLMLTLALSLGPALAQEGESPQVYELPGEAVFPEGIALDEQENVFYVGSTTDGAIYQGDLDSGEVTTFAEGRQPTAVGLELDENGRLWAAGGQTGQVFVYDTAGGELIQSYSTPQADATFINDLTATGSGIYITDSMRPIIFRVPLENGQPGELEPWLELTGTPLEYQEGFNLNGIVASPDGRYLITVQSNTGQLYRIDTESQEVIEIDLGGEVVMAGDGMLLDGRTLYVVRNAEGVIVPIELSEDYTSGTVGEGFSDPSLMFPTTIAKAGDTLLVVNSQFNTRGEGMTPELPFTVSRVPIP